MIKPSVDHIIFDWGDTIMKDDPSRTDAMYLWPEVELVEEGTAELLARLAETYTLIIATSAAASNDTLVRRALARVGVDGYFSAVFTSKMSGVPKTDAQFWQHIMQELSVGAERLLMVGDGFEGDVKTPAGLGIQSLWYNGKSAESRTGENYSTIHRLSDLVG